jgi:CHAT domain-containing protein
VLDGIAESRGAAAGKARRNGARVMGGAPASSSSEGVRLADVGSLRNLARLPGTARELEAMSKAYPPGSATIRLADAATEGRLKSEPLTGVTVLALSTHGLLAGEASQLGVSETGLVLTPPREPTPQDDGLLTASEIAALKTDAEWVILSACNTAAGDGSLGAEGLSGLARSFFYAGAQSLLASHWPVRDDVAAVLTVKILELERANLSWTRAQALQAAMKAIREDASGDAAGATWAHPNAWAPFTLIGDAAM